MLKDSLVEEREKGRRTKEGLVQATPAIPPSTPQTHLQRSLDTVKYIVHDSWSQFYTQRCFTSLDWITHSQPTGILIGLDGGSVSLQLDDLSYELAVSYTDDLVHGSS
jgi:hypothetical protein